MIETLLGFFELGAIVLAWSLIWQFLIKGVTALHANSPAAQGLAAAYHA